MTDPDIQGWLAVALVRTAVVPILLRAHMAGGTLPRMTDRDITPALTPDEWAAKQTHCPDGQMCIAPHWNPKDNPGEYLCIDAGVGSPEATARLGSDRRHALAALALYGQPYGFTWEDARLCRDIAAYLADKGLLIGSGELSTVAARIAALLPPREA